MPLEMPSYRRLPNGKSISALGFGCSSLWAKPNFDPHEAHRLLEAAVDEGINHFDTAPSYADGEVRLGQFLAKQDASKFVISTKVGTEVDHIRSFEPSRMRASLTASLERLGLNCVDVLYLHGPSIDDLSPEVFTFFDDLKAAGLITFGGVNSFDPKVVAACKNTPIDVIMLQYSVAERRFDDLIIDLVNEGKTVMAGTVLAQSIFNLRTFIPRDRRSAWYLARALKNDPAFVWRGIKLARQIASTNMNGHEAAIRFAVAHTALTSCLFGTSKIEHLRANTQAAQSPLSDEIVAHIIGSARVSLS